ncbi:MAG: divergent polysaccharide deacetylase family protein [Desulfobulbaceae bacterium]|nr:divergent polysaccharide deacetylase family protein [Desulfobulbaceae bacterium]
MPAKKKTAKKKGTAKKRRLFVFFTILLLVTATLIVAANLIFLQPGTSLKHPDTTKKASGHTPQPAQKKNQRSHLPPGGGDHSGRGRDLRFPDPEEKKKTKIAILPKIAILIDDMGFNRSIGKELIELDIELSFSFLPAGPHTRELLKLAQKKERDIMLHLPMEPVDPQWDPGPNALYLSMSTEKIRRTFEKNLSAVPMAVGINNHMGSRFTENGKAMRTLLELTAKKDLFFLDSLTSSKSVGYEMAKKMRVRTCKRDIFLDNSSDKATIIKQLEALLRIAEARGAATGIAHPKPPTLQALSELKEMLLQRADLVKIHSMAR